MQHCSLFPHLSLHLVVYWVGVVTESLEINEGNQEQALTIQSDGIQKGSVSFDGKRHFFCFVVNYVSSKDMLGCWPPIFL